MNSNYVYNTHVQNQSGRVNASALYTSIFGKIPGSIYVYPMDPKKAYDKIMVEYGADVIQEMQYTTINTGKKEHKPYCTIIVLGRGIIVELGKEYCEIIYPGKADETVLQIQKMAQQLVRKRRTQEINMITKGDDELELSSMDIKRTRLDLPLYYNDDFIPVDELIRKRLNKQNDKGIVLLHGLPGTGKTTYLRYLVGKIKKRVLFMPPDMAQQIGNPDLVKLLTDNPNSVLVIEDAENIIMQRSAGHSSTVSNLLNISDGLMSDFLNVQLICTFNSPVSAIDTALMRKGRLIARYEFGKLPIEKAQKLSDKLGYKTRIDNPMSLAEITNQDEQSFNQNKPSIGFNTSVQTA